MSLYIFTENTELKTMLFDQLNKHRWTDSGFDIPLAEPQSITGSPMSNQTINLQIRIAVLEGEQTRPCLLLPRSSIGTTPYRIVNSIGLIDQGYRGLVQAKVDLVQTFPSQINRGTRLFQLCRHNFLAWDSIIIVSSLEELPAAPDTRGEGGFGSTGI